MICLPITNLFLDQTGFHCWFAQLSWTRICVTRIDYESFLWSAFLSQSLFLSFLNSLVGLTLYFWSVQLPGSAPVWPGYTGNEQTRLGMQIALDRMRMERAGKARQHHSCRQGQVDGGLCAELPPLGTGGSRLIRIQTVRIPG